MNKLVVGNWKMHGSASENAEKLQALSVIAASKKRVEATVCLPSIFLPLAKAILENSALKYGAQDVSMFDSGAHTGDISATMLQEVGASYVIVGHSERRVRYGETNEVAAHKALAALSKGIRPIYCVGESAEDRKLERSESFVRTQLLAAMDVLGAATQDVVFAYEPVWAIGTGNAASLNDIRGMHDFIRHTLSEKRTGLAPIQLLYGGSMNASNAAEILALPNVDGGLVGSASLNVETFAKIIQAATGEKENSPLK